MLAKSKRIFIDIVRWSVGVSVCVCVKHPSVCAGSGLFSPQSPFSKQTDKMQLMKQF